MTPASIRVLVMWHRSRGMVIGELRRALGDRLTPDERSLWQSIDAAVGAENEAVRAFLHGQREETRFWQDFEAAHEGERHAVRTFRERQTLATVR